MSNTAIWDALGKTDPHQTKPFNRAGGFKGTAVKPMWVLRRLTEQFGPAGVGWGVNQPSFQVVNGDGEILVYCTVSAWHTKPENVLWGVGGDKVTAKRSGGSFNDDEAFKKAFTDAVNNAFKSIGVGADIHMGLFDDDKYVSTMEREFAGPPVKVATITDEQRTQLMGMLDAYNVNIAEFLTIGNISDLRELAASEFEDAVRWINKKAGVGRHKRAA